MLVPITLWEFVFEVRRRDVCNVHYFLPSRCQATSFSNLFQTVLKMLISGPRRTFFSKPSQTCPNMSPNPSQTLPKTSEKSRKSDPELTSGRRESNPPPPDSKSLDHSTRLLSPQNIASLKIFYVSKIESVCERPRRGFF